MRKQFFVLLVNMKNSKGNINISEFRNRSVYTHYNTDVTYVLVFITVQYWRYQSAVLFINEILHGIFKSLAKDLLIQPTLNVEKAFFYEIKFNK